MPGVSQGEEDSPRWEEEEVEEGEDPRPAALRMRRADQSSRALLHPSPPRMLQGRGGSPGVLLLGVERWGALTSLLSPLFFIHLGVYCAFGTALQLPGAGGGAQGAGGMRNYERGRC